MSDEETSPESRRARLDGARRRTRRLIVGTLAAVVVLAAAAAVAGFAFAGADESPDASPSTTLNTSRNGLQLPELERITTNETRALTNAAPLRLWVGGDSLAGAFGPALGEAAGSTGVVDTTIDYKVSSGLAKSGVRNWVDQAEADMEEYDPEAAVFIVGANDASIVSSHDSDDDGTPDWEPGYREKVASVMDTLVGGSKHRTVLWLGSPTMRDDGIDRGVKELNRVMREESEKRGPDVVYVDAYRLFAGNDGGFTMYLPTDKGEVRVRVYDGVHLTPAGAEHLARAVFTLLDARWHILEHATKGKEIRWSYADSSGEGDGYSSNSGRVQPSYGDDDDTYSPTTAPPVATTTAAPVTTTTPTTSAPVTTTSAPSAVTSTTAP